ncbi:MAG: hypothetical protein ACREF1_02620, partial [Acetobacteraceae bacterium]
PLRRRMRLLTACDFWARELARAGGEPIPHVEPGLAALMQRAAARIGRTIETLSDGHPPPMPHGDAPDGRTEEAADAQATLMNLSAGEEASKAAHLLLRMDAALLRLATNRG